MSSNMDDAINEPKLDASNCNLFSDSSEEIKLHYKLKFPGTYSIPTSRILDLLENEVLFSHLENSVKSFVYHAREVNKIDKRLNSIDVSNPTEMNINRGTKPKQNNILTKPSDSTKNEVAEVFELPPSSTDLSVYDSVHSIKIPWSSYESVSIKSSKSTFFRPKKQDKSEVGRLSPQPVSGLVFERIEKSLPFPLKRKHISPTKLKEKKEKSMRLISSNNEEINNVITLDEN